MSNDLALLNNQLSSLGSQEAIAEWFKKMTAQHKTVSNIKTPKNEVKKDFGGQEYVEVSYMRRVANAEFPGWSFTIHETKTHAVAGVEVAFTVHGRLTWVDNGVIRQGDMVASHQNQVVYKKIGKGQSQTYALDENKNKIPSGYLSVSNAWKSSVTECQKKAFNSYMNIADDVYRNVDVSLDEADRRELLKIITPIDSTWLEEEYGKTVEEVNDMIVGGTINKSNINVSRKKMQGWRDDWNEKQSTDAK